MNMIQYTVKFLIDGYSDNFLPYKEFWAIKPDSPKPYIFRLMFQTELSEGQPLFCSAAFLLRLFKKR